MQLAGASDLRNLSLCAFEKSPQLMRGPLASRQRSEDRLSFLVHDGRTYEHVVLERPLAGTDVVPPAPYPCLLWDTRGDWTRAERDFVVTTLLDSDCRYVVSGGATCEQWHDEVDETYVARTLDAETDERFVMTTWHTDQSVADVAFFFVWNTNFDEHDFRRFLVLQLGDDPARARELREAVMKAVLHPEDLVGEDPEAAG
jgi:hypothetical protein